MIAGEGDLGSAREVKVVSRQVVNLLRMLVEEAGTAHDLRGHEGRGHHRDEARCEGLVEGHRHERQLQAGANSLEVVEAGTRDFRTALRVDRVEALTDGEMISGLKTLGRKISDRRALVAQDHEVLFTSDGHAVEDEVRQEAGETLSLSISLVRARLQGLHLLSELFRFRENRGAFFL